MSARRVCAPLEQSGLSLFLLTYLHLVRLCQMLASEMLSVLPLAEKVVSVMISRSAALFRLPDGVLRDMELQWTAAERALGRVHPPRRVERRCAMKRTRFKVSLSTECATN